MKVAYVCADPGIPVFGSKGASVHAQEVMRAFLRRGDDVTLLARRIDGVHPRGLERVKIVPIDRPEGSTTIERERWLLAANCGMRSALEALGPVDLIYERHALWSYGAMEYARYAGVASVLEINAPLVEEQARYRELALRAEAEFAATRAFVAAGQIFCVSQGVCDATVAGGADRSKVEELANGVDTDRFHPGVPRSDPADPGVVTVGFVGSLRPWHGIELLVQAFAGLDQSKRRWRLMIVGDGPMMPGVKELTASLGMNEQTLLTGAVAPDDVPKCLASIDIAVAPYPKEGTNYFSPLKLFEYMAAGRAIIASDIGQIQRVVDDGRTGVLVPPGDIEALTSAIARLGNDPVMRSAMGSAARARALSHHTWDKVIERVVERALPARFSASHGGGS
jgi:glycosyltransferase involved in cell wall biosynthesis